MPDLAAAARGRLDAARLIGAGAVAVLGQFAVDMPAGYFGAADRITRTGMIYTTVVTALVLLGVAGHLAHRRWNAAVVPILLALNIGAFVAPVVSDPIPSAAVLTWNLFLLGRFFFPIGFTLTEAASKRLPESADSISRWLVVNGPAMRHLTTVSLLATTAVVGYRLGGRIPAQVVCVVLDAMVIGLSAPFLIRLLRGRGRWPLLAAALLAAAAVASPRPTLALALAAGYQALLLAQLVGHAPVFAEVLGHFYGRPALLVLVSFLVIIGLGTLLLSFPAAGAHGAVAPVDALFTATSAACVTGLIVLDTPHDFTPFGQAVILLLIQAGGLNIMVLSAFAALLLGRGVGLRGEQALGELLDLSPAESASRLVRFIIGSTLAFEGVGALLLSWAYVRHDYALPAALWRGVFHAVSAFCNAGFALQTDSLAMFQKEPWAQLVVAVLITVGGIGFAVLAHGRPAGRRRRNRNVAIQARLVLSVSGILVAVGTLWIAIAEWNHALAGLAPGYKIVNAAFQSVTCRTAGFNTIGLGGLQPATVLFMMMLMFIGASPGGTGGGIKTTTAAVLFSAIGAIARGEPRVTFFRRTIPLETVYRSAAIAVVSVLVLFLGCASLLATQTQGFETLLFEVMSALGTVGLSLGATSHLDSLGKVVIIVVMLAGRVGPLSLALLLGRRLVERIGYPEARIMVG